MHPKSIQIPIEVALELTAPHGVEDVLQCLQSAGAIGRFEVGEAFITVTHLSQKRFDIALLMMESSDPIPFARHAKRPR